MRQRATAARHFWRERALMEFERPYLLILAVASLLPVIAASARKRWRYPPLAVIGRDLLSAGWARKATVALRAAAILALAVAMAGPTVSGSAAGRKRLARNIFILLDISRSMERPDFPGREAPLSRIDAAKQVVASFLSKNRADRVGLIAFSTTAYTVCPLTFDRLVAGALLDNVNIGLAGERTAIGDALTLALARLKSVGFKSSLILLVTDGRNTAGKVEPLEAAAIAQEFSVPIYAVGIGRTGEPDAPEGDSAALGNETKVDVQLLEQMAQVTKGRAFLASQVTDLGQVMDAIGKVGATEMRERDYADDRLPALIAAIAGLLLAIELVLCATVGRTVPFGL